MTANTVVSNQKSGTKKVLKYIFLPGIIPRAKELGGSGFGYLAFLIARVYQGVRILPPGHAFTNPSNIGQFGIRQVIGEAANHIKLSRNNIDQIIIFFAVLAAMVIMLLQFVALILLVFSGQAWAADVPAPGSFGGIFATPNPTTDIAFLLLDNVFGIPDFFNSGANIPTSFHTALQALFQFYNLAILIVAVLIFLYYVVVVVAETAQTGTPFGKRFSHIYAPLRLVAALGLLVPLNYGLNASQYITLFAARMGSGMATNGWVIFNRGLLNPIGAEGTSLIAEPNIPNIYSMTEFMSIANACRAIYTRMEEAPDGITIEAYIITEGSPQEMSIEAFNTAHEASGAGDIEIVFGRIEGGNAGYAGGVTPHCGIIKIPGNVGDLGSIGLTGDASPASLTEYYFRMIMYLWDSPQIVALGERMADFYDAPDENNICSGGPVPCVATDKPNPPISWKEEVTELVRNLIAAHVTTVISNMRASVDLSVSQELLDRGWGGAGIWYNEIARLNGAIIVAIENIPAVKEYPLIMNMVKEANEAQSTTTKECEMFSPNLADNMSARLGSPANMNYAQAMNATYKYWRCEKSTGEKIDFSGNIFVDVLNVMLGTEGLFDIRSNSDARVHPLAQLTAIGKGMVDSSISNLGRATVSAFGGGLATLLGPHSGATLTAMSGFLVSLTTIGLAIGFLLYYVLPFLPFIYFFFAVGAWVKTIFEAMVGAPLWALAHLRIDGDGFAGKSAMNGYFLIFEIFVRPILTVFGLIGGMAIFTALAVILNEVFDLVVLNVTGTDIDAGTGGGTIYLSDGLEFSRGIIDQFFFTIVYAVLLYMMGTSSFKMIDLVPNNILRWMGAGVASFGDQGQDPTQGLGQYAAIGGATIGGQLAGGITQLSGAGGQAAAGAATLGK